MSTKPSSNKRTCFINPWKTICDLKFNNLRETNVYNGIGSIQIRV